MTNIAQAVLAVLVCAVVAACGVQAFPSYTGAESQDVRYRATADTDDIPTKPVRDDGLGSLLLKNLRFRDLSRRYSATDPMDLLLSLERGEEGSNGNKAFNAIDAPSKRQQGVSLSQLAELLHTLKSRGVDDDGVKLQSLRFGK